MRRAGLFVGIFAAGCSLYACSRAEKAQQAPAPAASALPAPVAEPSPEATATPTAAPAPPPVFDQPVAPSASAAPRPTFATPSAPKTPPALKPVPTLGSTPSPSLGKRVSVSLANHYSCSSTEKREGVMASPEPRGARLTIIGQGPCPGDVYDWTANTTETRVDITASHGAANKCRCTGSGDLVLRGLDPGTYDVTVNGGYDRPIATHITVSQ